MPLVALLLLLQHLLARQDHLVDEEAPQLAGHRVAFLVLPLVLLAQLEDLLNLVALETDLGLEALAGTAEFVVDVLLVPVGQSRALERSEVRDLGVLDAVEQFVGLSLLDD